MPGVLECDNCGKKLTDGEDTVYYEPGYTYNACSMGCIAALRLNVHQSTVEHRIKSLE